MIDHHRKWKMNHPCVVCGEKNPDLIEAAHIDPRTKLFNLSQASSVAAFDEEAKKCVGKCVSCHNAETSSQHGMTKDERRLARRQFVAAKMAERGCCDKCGKEYDGRQRQWHFDHKTTGDKKNNVSWLVHNRAPFNVIATEITKCDLLCCGCHKLVTDARRPLEWQLWLEHCGGASIDHLATKFHHTKRRAEEVIEHKIKRQCILERAYGHDWTKHVPGME
jgi:hypothetical protein